MADKDKPAGGGAPGDKGPGGPTDIRSISITDEMKRSYRARCPIYGTA